jgi:hypothetical protein
MKKLATILLLLILGATAFADQELNLYNQYCTKYSLGVADGFGSWHNAYGSPSCALSGSQGGNGCAGYRVQVVQRNKNCTYVTTYSASSNVLVQGTCGAILSPEFYIYDSGAASI